MQQNVTRPGCSDVCVAKDTCLMSFQLSISEVLLNRVFFTLFLRPCAGWTGRPRTSSAELRGSFSLVVAKGVVTLLQVVFAFRRSCSCSIDGVVDRRHRPDSTDPAVPNFQWASHVIGRVL